MKINLESYWWITLDREMTDEESENDDCITFEIEENILKNILKEKYDDMSIGEFLDSYTCDDTYEVYQLLKNINKEKEGETKMKEERIKCCPNCGEIIVEELNINTDELGEYYVCPKCGGSADVGMFYEYFKNRV